MKYQNEVTMAKSVNTMVQAVTGNRSIEGFRATILNVDSVTETNVSSGRQLGSPNSQSIETTHTTKGSMLVQLEDGAEDEVRVVDSELVVRPGSRIAYVRSTTSGGKGKKQQSEIEAIANLDTSRHEILRSYLSLSERIQLWCFYGFGSLLFWGLFVWLFGTALSTFFSFLIPDITLSPFGWVIAFCGSGAAVYHLLIGRILWRDWKAANKTYDMSEAMVQALISAPEDQRS